MTSSPIRNSVDPLDQALHHLRATGMFYCRSELSAPWGLELPVMPGCIWFHAITAGQFQIQIGPEEEIQAAPGDFILIPQGRAHRAQVGAPRHRANVIDLPHDTQNGHYGELRYGGGGEITRVICGVVRLEHPFAFDWDGVLPDVIHLDSASMLDAAWMESTLRIIAAESKVPRPGGETIITRLCDVLVIQAIRHWLTRERSHGGWLGGLRDERIGRVMVLAHQHPERPWSVETLASEAGMSRSGFAARFHEFVGEPPMHYVTRVRMRVAQSHLRAPHCHVGELAFRLGYRSEAAFCRAFKRFVGVTPGSFNRSARKE